MNILMATDSNTYCGCELVVYTTLTHNKNVNFYILTMDIEIDNEETGEHFVYRGLNDWQKSKLRRIVKYFDKNSHITIIDAKDYYLEHLKDSPNKYSCFTPYATLRLMADIILPHVHNVLYLDCDTAVMGDITGVYEEYTHKDCNYAAWMAEDACDGEGEMVSGVMIMNLDKMRETGFLATARRNYMQNKYRYPDQDAIRDAGKPVHLPQYFGFCNNLDDCFDMPLVLHFTNQLSPKIYTDKGRTYFFKKFPFLQYVKDGVELIDRINFKD
jgi:lipopolysaccharide biosynthesis glycosyltransferase